MKKMMMVILFTTIIISCKIKPEYSSEDKLPNNSEENISDEKLSYLINEFSILYNDLLIFKNEKEFIEKGFGIGGPYNYWIKNVERFKNHPDSNLLIKKGFLFGDLEILGLEYVSSKGEETEYSRYMRSTIDKTITPETNTK